MTHAQMQVQLSSLIGHSSAGHAAPATAAAAEARTSRSSAPPAGILKHIAKKIITEFSEELFKTPHVSGGGPNCTGGTQYEDVTGKKLKFATKTLHRLIPVLNNGTTVTSFYSNVVCPSSNRGGVST
jgi:hypothetical protein